MRTLITLLLIVGVAPLGHAQKVQKSATPPVKKAETPTVKKADTPPTKKAEEPVVHVVVRPVSEVANRLFTLGEIADITGQDKALQEQLAAVEIGAAPFPGMSRPLLPGDI